MFVKGHCSPRKGDIKSSCLSKKTLRSIAKILNQEINANIKIKKTSKEKLYNDITKYLKKTKCKENS